MTHHTQDVYTETQTARNTLLETNTLQSIDGACHENAVHLADHFYHNTSWTPYIRWGAVHPSIHFKNLEQAEKLGAVHFWVEIQTQNDWYIADLFTMKSRSDGIKRGEIFASKTLPNTYKIVPTPNTLFEYTPKIKPGHMLGYDDHSFLSNIVTPITNPFDAQ